MPEKRRQVRREFREGAVRIVRETNKPVAQVAADLGINPGTLGNWVKQDKIARGEGEGLGGDERVELARLRAENAELRRHRGPVGLRPEELRPQLGDERRPARTDQEGVIDDHIEWLERDVLKRSVALWVKEVPR